MREIDVSIVKETISALCLKANFVLRNDILKAIRHAITIETDQRAKNILRSIVENARIARRKGLAICQDTGIAVVHMGIGQGVLVTGGSLAEAVNEGVREAYRKGCLRSSVVGDPMIRENTGTNTPASILTDIVAGDRIRIEVSPKGFGSENKSMIRMFRPTAGQKEIRDFIVDVARHAGPDACPPLVLGIGIGGTFEGCAGLAKRALFRRIDRRNPKKHIARLERDLVKEINALGMGPMGLGGKTTVFGVNILEAPTHIAGFPVAVNVSCHATRSAEAII